MKIETGQLAGQLGWYVFVDGRLDADIPASKVEKGAVLRAARAYPGRRIITIKSPQSYAQRKRLQKNPDIYRATTGGGALTSKRNVKVRFTADEVRQFMQQFPASGLRNRSYWFEFEPGGDLVDTDVPQQDDGPGASALSEDAKRYAFENEVPQWLR